jgi:uncharacterized protein YbjT (DUF2867 family)
MIAVMGATGRTGSQIARLLVDSGRQVRALGRSEPDVAGAQPFAGDAGDPAYLTEALAGADAVYTLLPYDLGSPDYFADVDRIGESIVAAVRAAGVPRVVALSSVGADVPSGTGFIAALHTQEQRLRALDGVDVLAIRPGAFFETYLPLIDVARAEGAIADVVEPDAPIPMVATRDVAAVAALALAEGGWSGFAVRELLGPRDLTHSEVARIIGEAIGMPELRYVRLPDAELEPVLRAMGFSEDTARLHLEFGHALSDGTIRPSARTPESTTPTTFEEVLAA